jgi:hypothetical protein
MPLLIAIIILGSTLLFSNECCVAADKDASVKFGASPHNDNGDCTICHVYPAETLRSWFVFGSTKRQLKDDLVEVCRKCHGSGFGHAIGKKTAVNHSRLPLDGKGEITCAITCHDMHVQTEDQKQKFYHLRLPFDALCVSCHDN